MNDLQAILEAFEESQKNGETTFLATVVNTKGSTYRRRGARMLMTSTGRMVGMVSGGCLENDIFEYTRQRMHSGKSIVVTYDTTAAEDVVWGFGLGCNGVVQVLIERLDVDSLKSPITFLQECSRNNQRGVLATVFGVEGWVNVRVGAHLMLNPDSTVTSDIEDSDLTVAVMTDAQTALPNELSMVKSYQLPSGGADVFIEVIQPPTPLVIFGAGPDAVPVAEFAKALGWHITIVDSRALEGTFKRFSMADKVILTRREIVSKHIFVDDRTVAVVMTHNYKDDLELLKMLMSSPARYLGFLGPRHRTLALLQDLRTEGMVYTRTQLQRLHGPIGIDIGADSPEEIAIAIIAEIQAVLANRSGGFLRNRTEPIHQRLDGQDTPTEQFKMQYVNA
jgi:xanthine/CO dehydrogenase XdhC/CoxF family maturation factor